MPLSMPHALLLSVAAVLVGATARAAESPAAAEASAAEPSADSPAAPDTATTPPSSEDPWIRRLAPDRNMIEVGLYGGLWFPSRRVELFEADFGLPDQGHKPLARVLPEIGARAGYYPLPVFGVEIEGGVIPGRTEDGDGALVWTGRGSLVGQLGRWSVTPFVLVGGGLLGVSSDRSVLGNDVDASMHFGGGAKLYVARLVQLRLDIRDIVAAGQGYRQGVVHNPEVLLGLSITLGRSAEQPPPPPPDSDGDGILDPDDRCKDEPGVLDFAGCPVPDSDGDGVLDPDDQCKDEPGVPDFDGCPVPDSDGDGILDPDDQCPDRPETVNNVEDEDGCPDEIPREVMIFTGVIEGIFFDTGKATIRPKSHVVLDQALDVLRRYPSLRVEISGHTDSRGDRELNQRLAQRRADAVKQFMVDRGIAKERLTTRGVGPDEPIANNKSKRGRAKNRRIEFKLLTP